MRKSEKRLIGWLIAIVAIAAVAGIFLAGGRPRLQPLTSRVRAVCSVIEYQYRELGLLPPSDIKNFYSSILGARFRSLPDRTKRIARNISMQSNTDRNSIKLTVSARLIPSDDGARRRTFLFERDWHRNPFIQTRRLLNTVTAGTRYWEAHLPNGPAIDQVFPESKSVSLPDVGFDRPHTKKQMRKYNLWLARMAGDSRLRDGWGRRVLLELDDSKTAGPILYSRSAGPDGKWQTDDDIALQRDVDTGRIISKKWPDTAQRGNNSSK